MGTDSGCCKQAVALIQELEREAAYTWRFSKGAEFLAAARDLEFVVEELQLTGGP